MKKGKDLLLLCLLLFMPFMAVAQEPATANSYIQQHIEQIQVQQKYRVGEEQIIARDLLPPLYSNNQFKLLWHNTSSVTQLLKAIGQSNLEGLTPGDYHLKSLQRLVKQRTAGMDYPSLKADFDILLSDAFIRLAYDKKFGKVDPQRLNPDWNLPEKKIGRDLVLRVDKAIANGTVDTSLNTLSPQFPIYDHLKNALAKYRRIQEMGSWQPIGYGPVLKPGMEDARIPILRKRLLSVGELTVSDHDFLLFDKQLEQAVISFQQRHYLEADGVIGKQTLSVLNQSVEQKIDQIRVNLERARWILHDLPDSYILVDIAGYSLVYHHKGKVIWNTRVVVGKPFHETPVFRADMKYLVINPTWTLPRSIITNETLPKIIRDPSYLQINNFEVIDHQGNWVNPASINWHSYSGRSFPYGIRQKPGPHNALGRIKFIFPNSHAVYLHDTPSRSLFGKDQRAFSHGCIRVDQPVTLGELILKNDGQNWDKDRIEAVIDTQKITTVKLNTHLPVMLLYWTVNASNGDDNILFKQDIYGRDKALLMELDGAFKFRGSVVNQVKAQ
ncbi:MAG: L,D-transpeptidase family protein [Thermodesulfobacteriota bacterium]|nr:L,D-transpeptidase family protein [Thermodesulfobacteriota bacterium]